MRRQNVKDKFFNIVRSCGNSLQNKYQSIVGPMDKKNGKNAIKVKFDTNKYITADNYQQLKNKIHQSFRTLSPNKYYQLFFINQDGKTITINSSTQFQLHSPLPTLTLALTNDSNLHFDNPPPILSQEHNQELRMRIDEIKKDMEIKLTEIQKKLYAKVESQVQKEVSNRKQRTSQVIHYGFKCNNCNDPEDIRGARYECAICDFNICQACQANGYQHEANHPLIKIRDQTQMLQYKNNTLKSSEGVTKKKNKKKKNKEKEKETEKMEIGSYFEELEIEQKKEKKAYEIVRQLELLAIPEDWAKKLITMYPNKSVEELADIFYQQHDVSMSL